MDMAPYYVAAAFVTVMMVVVAITLWRRAPGGFDGAEPNAPMGYTAWAAVLLTLLVGDQLGYTVAPHHFISLLILGAVVIVAPFLVRPWSAAIAAIGVIGLYIILGYHVWLWVGMELKWMG